MKLRFRVALLLLISGGFLAPAAHSQCLTDSKKSVAQFRNGVEPRFLRDVPLKAKFGNHFVCWSDKKLLEEQFSQSMFGPCSITSDGVDALFPFFGRERRSPAVSVLLQEKLFWGKFSETTGKPICDPPDDLGERGERYTIKERGAVTIRRDKYSDCKGWYVGKWSGSRPTIFFGCNGKEVRVEIDEIQTSSDVFVLCSVVVPGFTPRSCRKD
ncbi:hypothetical protein BSKO_05808 [Bryopsis sp. KO-2023]|nr:hypothetical protein BSKO_05808 [Bryopsis sp. KO-2023]